MPVANSFSGGYAGHALSIEVPSLHRHGPAHFTSIIQSDPPEVPRGEKRLPTGGYDDELPENNLPLPRCVDCRDAIFYEKGGWSHREIANDLSHPAQPEVSGPSEGRLCSVVGCGRPHNAKDLCKSHYRKAGQDRERPISRRLP